MKYHIFVYTGHILSAISDLRVLTVLDLSLRSTETQPTCKDCRGGRLCGAPLSKPYSPLPAHQKNSNNNNNWLFFSYNILEALRKKYEIFFELRSRESNCLPSMWNGIIPSTCRLKVILSEGSNSEYTSAVATAVQNERKKKWTLPQTINLISPHLKNFQEHPIIFTVLLSRSQRRGPCNLFQLIYLCHQSLALILSNQLNTRQEFKGLKLWR